VLSLLLALDVAARAATPAPSLSDIALRADGGRALVLEPFVRAQRLTAVVFFSATCPCFAAHRARLAALARDLDARGVRFVVVDSERHAAGEAAAGAASGLPIWRDDGARLARRLDARQATETFVFDATGALRYHGGLDGDRTHLTSAATPRLRDALTGLLAGKAPSFASAKTLGCVLRLR